MELSYQPLNATVIYARLLSSCQANFAQQELVRRRFVWPKSLSNSYTALWLGHESPSTTHLYVEADLALKEQALQKVQPPKTNQLRFQPTDALLRFLENV